MHTDGAVNATQYGYVPGKIRALKQKEYLLKKSCSRESRFRNETLLEGGHNPA